jgi:hypothetical protein
VRSEKLEVRKGKGEVRRGKEGRERWEVRRGMAGWEGAGGFGAAGG